MSEVVVASLTGLTLTAFAANSLLCRAALAEARIDPASFTFVRLASGAALLSLLVHVGRRGGSMKAEGSWRGGAYLFGYAILFSLAYERIPAGVGALVLFAFVQFTMLGAAVRRGDGPSGLGWAGVALAMGGLAFLTLPGADAPAGGGLLLMAGSGISWGLYSVAGARASRPVLATMGNFGRATVLALLPAGVALLTRELHADVGGVTLAMLSGALASGLGYVLWYAVLPHLRAARSAVVQLAVPVLAALGGLILLGEAASIQLFAASAAILAGIGIVVVTSR